MNKSGFWGAGHTYKAIACCQRPGQKSGTYLNASPLFITKFLTILVNGTGKSSFAKENNVSLAVHLLPPFSFRTVVGTLVSNSRDGKDATLRPF